MPRLSRPVLFALLLGLPAACLGKADAPTPTAVWTIDAGQSRAQFRVRLLGILPASGSMEAMRGSIAFDGASQKVQVDAELRTAAVTMRNASHAAWVRSPEFFDAARHPLIHYRSASFPLQVLHDGGPIEGELTLRGVTRPIRFNVGRGDCHPQRAAPCTVEVFGQLRRSEFGMSQHAGTVGDWVTLRLHIVAAPPPAPAPAP
jgi:polyisoprenoid-binding protein YceI